MQLAESSSGIFQQNLLQAKRGKQHLKLPHAYLTFASKPILLRHMKKVGIVLFLWLFGFFYQTKTFAIYNPLEHPNNFNGIHILFTSELEKATELVNSKEGAWGYVTIPIQAGDKNLEKWQSFMDEAKRRKIIPILRLSTEGDYFNTSVWRKPTQTDLLDFANFLNSLNWPIENRYVVIFNEMNRFDEWGGETPDPKVYTDLLNYAVDVFKSRSTNFFIIMGGLDNASPNDGVKYMDNFAFINKMHTYDKTIFNKIDGFASHSYPNPDFSQPPLHNQREGITTYQYEYDLINSYASRKIPVFITETGWNSKRLGENLVSKYYKIAYDDFWNKDKDKIVAITPFLLSSGGGSFDTFSFIQNGKETEYFKQAKDADKTKGEPLIQTVKGIAVEKIAELKTKFFFKPETDYTLANLLFINYIKFFF